MSLEHIGALILVLVVVLIVGNVWFHLVEALLSRIKSLLTRHKEPPTWHPLPTEQAEHDAGLREDPSADSGSHGEIRP